MERRNQARGATEWADTYGNLGAAPQSQLRELPLQLLDPWQDAGGNPQPFDPYTQEELSELAENIRENGVIEAICVRPKPNGRFQIISGHHRTEASRLAGLTTIPAKIEYMDDDQATIRMVDANLKRRKKIPPSNKAFAYKLKMDAMNHQGKTSGQLGQKLTRDMIADNSDDSSRQIQRYIRLTELIQPLLDLVDKGKLAFIPAVELSYLSKEEQQSLMELIEARTCRIPSMAQATRLREAATEAPLTAPKILEILTKPKTAKTGTVKFTTAKFSKYFPPEATAEEMEATILAALAAYCEKRKA